MTKIRAALGAGLAVGLVFVSAVAPAGEAPSPTQSRESDDAEARQLVRQGLDRLMDGDPDAASEIFRRIETQNPQSPLGYLFEADAVWWKIYYTTADLVDPEVLDVVSSATTPYDAHFADLVKTAIAKSAAGLRERQDARLYLYQGLAYALRARLEGLRGRDLSTARAGKKMRSLSLAAVRLDPHLTDAYLGLGLYNYFVDTLPTIVKLLRFLIALPGGSRETGLEQLTQVAEKGDLARGDAKFQLAKDYSRLSEEQYAKSLALFQEFGREYPGNPLWPLLAAGVNCRLGHTQECAPAYRDILRRTAGETSEVRRAVNGAARLALQKMHADGTKE